MRHVVPLLLHAVLQVLLLYTTTTSLITHARYPVTRHLVPLLLHALALTSVVGEWPLVTRHGCPLHADALPRPLIAHLRTLVAHRHPLLLHALTAAVSVRALVLDSLLLDALPAAVVLHKRYLLPVGTVAPPVPDPGALPPHPPARDLRVEVVRVRRHALAQFRPLRQQPTVPRRQVVVIGRPVGPVGHRVRVGAQRTVEIADVGI